MFSAAEIPVQRSSDSEDDDLAWLTIDHWHVFHLHRRVGKLQQLLLSFHWTDSLKHIFILNTQLVCKDICLYVCVCVCVCDCQAARLLFVLRHKWLQLFFRRMSSPSKFSSLQDEAVVHCLVSVRRTQPLRMFSHFDTDMSEKLSGCEFS